MPWFLRRNPTRVPPPSTTRLFGQDDGQLQASVPPQLQSQDWLNIASLPRLAKRAVDLAGAFVGLLLLTPVILLIALVIRIEGRGPILFGNCDVDIVVSSSE